MSPLARLMAFASPSLAVVAFVALVLAGSLASAQTGLSSEDPGPEARARLQLGTVLYEEGRFAEAAVHFERAHETSGHPAMIYNAFLCHRQADQPVEALRTLDIYLGTGAATAEERRALMAQREALASLVSALQIEGADASTRAASRGEARVDAAPEPVPPSSEGPDLVGPSVLLGAGAAALLGAAVTGGLVVSADSSLAEHCPLGRCDADVDAEGDIASGRALAIATDVLWASGAALAVGGLVWLVVELMDGGTDGVAQCRAARCVGARF
ncbi:MAG: hypothetical protein AB8I08_35145 [Sandaracinaceae bacterium]